MSKKFYGSEQCDESIIVVRVRVGNTILNLIPVTGGETHGGERRGTVSRKVMLEIGKKEMVRVRVGKTKFNVRYRWGDAWRRKEIHCVRKGDAQNWEKRYGDAG